MSWSSDSSNHQEPHIDKIFKGTFPDTDDNEIIREFGFQTKTSKNIQKRVNFIV